MPFTQEGRQCQTNSPLCFQTSFKVSSLLGWFTGIKDPASLWVEDHTLVTEGIIRERENLRCIKKMKMKGSRENQIGRITELKFVKNKGKRYGIWKVKEVLL